ncbi:MAG: thiamine pyrophosphate-binding protein [Deltaproteobacteria bacterium]|jgi:acetolactate synthase-1/2/3 large subunit|nr:thiamine pyrophosphate-binding protein [Deltaproteobacteria bacterium]
MELNSGDIIGQVLRRQGVQFLFTLCGGHISPILIGAKKEGIRVVDVRDEVNAVFAADAVGRITGVPGVAAVTAGPGVTNSLTALKNAQMAQTPLVLLGGAAPTVLRNRGALQDIDQLALLKSIAKMAVTVRRNCDVIPVLEKAFDVCRSGVPGPVFVECPIDILYSESLVRQWYGARPDPEPKSGLRSKLLDFYLQRHVDQMFACELEEMKPGEYKVSSPDIDRGSISKAAELVAESRRPVMIVGSQAMLQPGKLDMLAGAIGSMGVPVYLTGMARGLLGRSHPMQMRHQRKKALQKADLVIIAGMPCDFRLNYGRAIGSGAKIIAVNRSKTDLKLNCRPNLAVLSDPFLFLCALADEFTPEPYAWASWIQELQENDSEREAFIAQTAGQDTEFVNPLAMLQKLDKAIDDDGIIVADGGDFVATASYILQPSGPLKWLDPGVFGTLGVGAGFALGSKLVHPQSEVWLIYGDGAAGFSLQEFDTFVRHRLPVIAVVGNDGGWTQIARDQIALFGDDVATKLHRTDYQVVAEGFGAKGFLLDKNEDCETIFQQAKQAARDGQPVLINAQIGLTDFRQGSISM